MAEYKCKFIHLLFLFFENSVQFIFSIEFINYISRSLTNQFHVRKVDVNLYTPSYIFGKKITSIF